MVKVGDLNKVVAKEKPKGRQEYNSDALVATNPEAKNMDGLLTIVPTDYDSRKHKPLKKTDFATEAVFIRQQAFVAAQRAEWFAQRSAELVGKADRLEKFGSESARKTATRLARAKYQMADLRKQLLATGMAEAELDDLIANM